jgi:hypothetical protein
MNVFHRSEGTSFCPLLLWKISLKPPEELYQMPWMVQMTQDVGRNVHGILTPPRLDS